MDLISRYAKPWITRLLTIFIGAYVENLSTEQLDLGVSRGEVDLKDLKLKKGALDKLALPFDIVEGRIGRFLLKMNWSVTSAASIPLQIEVEDVQILLATASNKQYSKEEEELREEQLKQNILARADALRLGEATEQLSYTQSLINSIIARILNNVQISIKNVHLRYEDAEAVPKHPFAIGVTLARLSAKTTDENWQPAYIEGKAQTIHKLAQLDSIAVYFNTDCKSMSGLSYEASKSALREQISSNAHPVEHQYILKPVSGVGHLIMYKNWVKNNKPRYDTRLLFHELSFSLDHHQYRNMCSLADEFQIYVRRRRYLKYRPDEASFSHNYSRALWKFAITAVIDKIHDKNERWTWLHFRTRRDDRHRYIELFKDKEMNNQVELVLELETLEKKLSYSDIRLYRSIARSQLKKDKVTSKRKEEKKQEQSWGSWFWGTTAPEPSSPINMDTFSDEDKKELYEILDYDERAEIAESFEVPREAISMRLNVQLQRGSFSLKASPLKGSKDIVSLIFDFFEMGGIQRRENFEILLSLGNFRVYDGTHESTVHSQIVQVKDNSDSDLSDLQAGEDKPFFSLKYEYKPLDDRADNGLTVHMRSMEIIYQRGYIEAIYEFFRPPESQLQSVDSLLHAAGETLEGIQKETRMNFEHALETHKTIDLRLDMHAPIIIIPECITQEHCNHLVIDAGRILVESNLADKSVLQDIEKKRGQQYSEKDYKRLEAMMYDSYSVKLISAQFVIGDSLEACRNVLQAELHDPRMHLLERININFLVQNSIIPSARSIPRIKLSGMLPNMYLNLSDHKYKAIMRLLDVTIPQIKEVPEENFTIRDSEIFGKGAQEYRINDDSDQVITNETSLHPIRSQEALSIHQHKFELQFQVNALQATMSHSHPNGTEIKLANFELHNLRLSAIVSEFEMAIDIGLRAINVTSLVPGLQALHLVSTKSIDDINLMAITYKRVQMASPDFLSVHGGYDQSIEIRLSTFIFTPVPEHISVLYNFIMTTFVPQNPTRVSQKSSDVQSGKHDVPSGFNVRAPSSKMRLRAYLASFQIWLPTDGGMLTLSLSTANVDVALYDNNMDVSAKLGELLLSSDAPETKHPDPSKKVLYIEGDDLLELQYQLFNEDASREKGMKSRIDMTAASLKVHFLDKPLNDIYRFLVKFSQLKGLYDVAAEAAVQRASKVEKMGFRLTVNSPIVVFPIDGNSYDDNFTLELGKLIAHNKFENQDQLILATLDGLRLSSSFSHDSRFSKSKILDDVHVATEIRKKIDVVDVTDREPDLQVEVVVSEVKLHLTQLQFGKLVLRSQSIPSVFSGDSKEETNVQDLNREPLAARSTDASSQMDTLVSHSLMSSSHTPVKKIDLRLFLPLVKLHLYDGGDTDASSLKEHGIVSFALAQSKLSYELWENGAEQAGLTVSSFNVTNTKPGRTKFREIIPEVRHDREQVRMLYNVSAGSSESSQLVITVDSPQILFSVEPVFSLMKFFQSAFPRSELSANTSQASESAYVPREPVEEPTRNVVYRLDLHNASFILLEDDREIDTRTIRLSIGRISISQQDAMVIKVISLGMSYARMDRLVDAVRFLDDVDVTYSSRTHVEDGKSLMTIKFVIEQDVVIRLSYRDILLITSITNKVVSSFSTLDADQKADSSKQIAFNNATSAAVPGALSIVGSDDSVVGRRSTVRESTKNLNVEVRGIQFIVIGDLHETPIFHVMFRVFFFNASNWTKTLYATTKLPVSIDYWNLKNSKWEPLVEPWNFAITLQREVLTGKTFIRFQSDELLDVNITSDFAELAIIMTDVWKDEKMNILQQPRGARAPYCIRNRTGGMLYVWCDPSGSNPVDSSLVTIGHDGQVDLRFEDWKKLREGGVSPGVYSIGVRFVDKPWDDLRSIPVGREGEYVYNLKPQTKHAIDKLLCEITIKNGIKIVTLRSTYKVSNQTFYPLEVTVVDNSGHPVHPIEKIAPGQDYALPIDAVTRNRIRLQPDAGFGYKWSPSIGWEDLRDVKSYTKYLVRCPHVDHNEAPFHFVLWPKWTTQSRDYPQMKLILHAPIELENLLPYDIQYKVYDKDSNHTWSSFLRKGGCTPIHSVHLSHLVLLNITAIGSEFKPSDFTIINADQKFEFEQETEMSLVDFAGKKCILNLNFVKLADAGGSFKVQIYSPYVVINKMGLPFEVRSSRAVGISKDWTGIDARGQRGTRTVYLLSHSNKNGNEFIFRIDESTWSQTIRFDAPSAETALSIPHQSESREICVGLSWTEGSGKYKLSKVITLAPRFVVYNKLPQPMWFREVGQSGRAELLPGEKSHLHYTRMDERKLLTIAYSGLNAAWSHAIDMEAIGKVHVRVRDPSSENIMHLVMANIVLREATIYIVISAHEGSWPFIIENKCDQVILFGQTHDGRDAPENGYVYKARPGERVPYAWDFPAMQKKRVFLSCNGRSRKVDIMEIGVFPPLRHNSGALSLDVRADGHTQILSITKYQEETSVYKPKRRRADSVSTLSSSTTEFEAVQDNIPPTFTVDFDLEGLGLSFINNQMMEIAYVSVRQLKLGYTNSPVSQSVHISCGTVQIDNQLHDASFPVLLQPTPISKHARTQGTQPTIQVSVVIINDSEHGVLFVKYASVLLQALTVELDEAFLHAIIDLMRLEGISWSREPESVLIRDNDFFDPSLPEDEQYIYFEVLELQPIVLSVSFVRNVTSGEESSALTSHNPFAVALNILTMTLANAEGIELRLNALGLTDARLTLSDIQGRISHHYRQEVLRQIYRVLGSADFLGNPVGLFTNVSSGVVDMFYEPWNGVVRHGTGELGVGIAKGAASFMKKTIFGLSDSVTKVTSSLGKGLSAATLDPNYQAKRRMTQRRNKPRHALTGVTAGAEALANSVASGVEGILMKPLEGADTGGAFGFIKGMGIGLVGAVTKPVVGVFDLAANVTEGIRNTTTVFDAPRRDRVRKPRHIPVEHVLQPYSARKAQGQSWMVDLSDGKYRKEYYIAHLELPGTDTVVLLTNVRILSFSSRDLRVLWDLHLTSVAGVQGEHSGIRFASKAGSDYDKFLIISDPNTKDWFFEQVRQMVQAFNSKRRLER